MSNELIYLGIGAAAVYFLSRKKIGANNSPVPVSSKPETSFTPGQPGTTPTFTPDQGFNAIKIDSEKQPIGIGPEGIVFGADDVGTLEVPGTIDETIAKINSYAKQIGSTPADSFSILLDNALQTNNNHGITMLNQAWTKMNQPKKSMLVPALAAAAGLYFMTR